MTRIIDPIVIDQIVEEVLSQLRQRGDAAPSSSTFKEVIKPSKVQPNQHAQLPLKVIEFHEAVITAETLKQRVNAGAEIRIAPGTILTPTARDYIRSHQISLCTQSPEHQAKSPPAKGLGIILASHLPEVVQTFLADVKRKSLSSWAVELESGTVQVVERVRSIICRGEAKQALVFAKTSHQIACLINRNSQCRAAVVQCGNDVRRVREEMAANVVCVDLQQPSFMGLKSILRTCAETLDLIRNPETRDL